MLSFWVAPSTISAIGKANIKTEVDQEAFIAHVDLGAESLPARITGAYS
jgi:hypothetical protein